MKRAPLVSVLSIALIGACSAKPSTYEPIATELNPTLEALKSAADSVLYTIGYDVETDRFLIKACQSVDGALQRLVDADVVVDPRPLGRPVHLASLAGALLDDRSLYCRGESEEQLRRCSRWCVVSWTVLAFGVEQVRIAANRDGVKIVSLSHWQ